MIGKLPVIGKAVKGHRLPLKGTPPVIGKNPFCFELPLTGTLPVIGKKPLCIGSVKDQANRLELNAVILKDVPWIKYRDGEDCRHDYR